MVIVEGKLGSSAAGNKPSLASHHPERSGAVRSYLPTMHRHTAEVEQELNFGPQPTVHMSATSIEAVRGVLATAHVFLKENLQEKDLWKVYRQEYGNEPFIRIVKTKEGVYRYPEPKILAGSNFCDIGFERDERNNRLVVISAIDNLVKGTSGNAIQAMNVMFGWDETLGLEFTGLHPV
jgi:N-acetyl-gamma-glutamyl-phosphate/LysW-gamma-L-alpha-aminoadipyl-6-phosphate reductase